MQVRICTLMYVHVRNITIYSTFLLHFVQYIFYFCNMYLDIKALRKDHDLTQSALAVALDIRRATLSQIENGKKTFTPKQLDQLIAIVGDISAYQFDESEINTSLTASERTQVKQLQAQIASLQEINRLKDELLAAKDIQMRSVLNSTDKETISVVSSNNKGKYIDWRLIDIPSDRYLEIKEGMFDRIIRHKEDLIEEWEKVFIEYLDRINFDRYKVILNRCTHNALFPLHYHIERESIICVAGSVIEMVNKVVLKKGDRIDFEKMEQHEILALEDAMLILLIEKV